MQRIGKAVIGGALVMVLAAPCSALEQAAVSSSDGKTHLTLGAGLLNGESGEYVYDADGSASGIAGYKISELQWDLDDVPMVGLEFTHAVSDRFTFDLAYWTNAGDGDSSMDDYDWLYVGLDWSDWSHHDNTEVRDVSRFDISGDFVIDRFQWENTDLYAVLGYRWDHLDWQAKGGEAIYSDTNFRDTNVAFPNVPVISYEQTYQTPYVGLGIRSRGMSGMTNITLDASLRFSDWVKGEDVDVHHLRDLRFEGEGDRGRWMAFDFSLDFSLSERFDVGISYSATEYDEIKATTLITDLTDGSKTFYSGDAAGLDHRSSMVSLDLGYRF
ncbi:omptin family outer membrane protease [Thiohalomonas denitrificans]|uniref:Omptin family protein n=1 Tax=Thiohalomonas denitrificans TaxID=415747 RepID=A0A1G5QZG4_9GAMM|nr:omptin family outer membrane protease [Thiohalomonas denitrificans]SCZ66960.1 Omptin family protein [Thiohalomonas denitrificans]